jgi:chitodextrinase
MKRIAFALALLTAGAFAGAACTVHQTEAPGLTGPSELALSVALSATPDTLTQDGRSLSTIGVSAAGPDGRPLGGVTFRLDILINGQPGDVGTLSTRTVTTASDGRATSIYTAPAPPSIPSIALAGTCQGSIATVELAGQCVQIVATAIGSNYDAAASHQVQLHLVPASVIIAASSLPMAVIDVRTSAVAAKSPVLFDASRSCSRTTDSGVCGQVEGALTSFQWDFGDGAQGSGMTTSHTYDREGTYLVRLTVTNDLGYSNRVPASTTVAVGAGAVPVPAFASSPTAPLPNALVSFDATLSKPGAGHAIVRYVWNWGDGTTATDSSTPVASHTFTAAGTYVVTLTVADDAGQTATVSGQVKVGVVEP